MEGGGKNADLPILGRKVLSKGRGKQKLTTWAIHNGQSSRLIHSFFSPRFEQGCPGPCHELNSKKSKAPFS